MEQPIVFFRFDRIFVFILGRCSSQQNGDHHFMIFKIDCYLIRSQVQCKVKSKTLLNSNFIFGSSCKSKMVFNKVALFLNITSWFNQGQIALHCLRKQRKFMAAH